MVNKDEQKQQAVSEKIILALDCDKDRALELTDMLSGRLTWVKVGMTLYYALGPQIVEHMHAKGLKVFLDLKLHDIPFQIFGAARAASLAGADILSVHGLGGQQMISEACRGIKEAAAQRDFPTKLIAISVLTSIDKAALESIGITCEIEDEVRRLALLADKAGADGMVCSPQEVAALRALLGPDALLITPGIRPASAQSNDQKRIATAAYALSAGASKLVIGRPITAAQDPIKAFDELCEEIR